MDSWSFIHAIFSILLTDYVVKLQIKFLAIFIFLAVKKINNARPFNFKLLIWIFFIYNFGPDVEIPANLNINMLWVMDILAMNLSPLKNLFPSYESRNALQFVVLQSHLYFKPRSHKAACVRTTMTSMRKSVGVSRESRRKDWASGAVCVRRAKALGRSVGRSVGSDGGRKRGMSLQHREGYFWLRSFFSLALGPIPHRQNAKQIVSPARAARVHFVIGHCTTKALVRSC